MDYEEFVKQLIEELELNMEEDVEIQRRKVTKNNGVEKDGITIKYPNSSVAPTVYAEDFYEKLDRFTVEEIARDLADNLERNRSSMPEVPELTKEQAMKNLYCTVVNTAENKEMLKNVPHEILEDLSIVPRFKVGDSGSFLVTSDICQTLKMSSSEVMEAAHANVDHDYVCQSMNEVLHDLMIHDGMSEDYVDELIQMQGDQCPMWILSNESRVDGAAVLTSPEALRSAHDRLGEDYYVLPSSRHEVILVPQSVVSDVEDLKSMVREVNATEVSKTDKLSDSVYKFDGRHLAIADTLEKSKNEGITEALSKTHAHSH